LCNLADHKQRLTSLFIRNLEQLPSIPYSFSRPYVSS